MAHADLTVNLTRTGAIETSFAATRPGKPELILLHGIGSAWSSWLPVIDRLAEQFSLLMPDLRGHGNSGNPASGYHPSDYAVDLNLFVAAVATAPVLVIGHSLGAVVAAIWTANHPDQCRAIVLEDPPFRSGARSLPMFDGWIELNALPEREIANFYRHEYPDWDEDDYARRAATMKLTHPAVFGEARQLAAAGAWPDIIPGLATAKVPSLLIYGDIDSGAVVMPSDRDRFAAQVSTGDTHCIERGNHNLHRDFSEPFLKAMNPWLTART